MSRASMKPTKSTGRKAVSSATAPRVPRAPKPPSTPESRRDLIYMRLGVTHADTSILPKITHILAKLPGGTNKAIEFLRGSSDPDARKWLATYDSLPESSRKQLPFEAYCLASGLTTKRVLEIITGACFEQSSSTASLLAAASHPDIVQATIDGALRIEYGEADRKMMHMNRGFLPSPKNSTTIIGAGGVQNNSQDNSNNLSISVGEVIGIEDKMSKIGNRFAASQNERLGIDEAAMDAEFVEQGVESSVESSAEDED